MIKLDNYREGLRQRLSRRPTKIEQVQLNTAYVEALNIAQTLVEDHGAKCVWLVGSVARRQPLRPHSDIDLAVEGMSPESYYKLVDNLQTTSGWAIDLIRLENVRPAVKSMIFSEGVILVTMVENLHYLITAIESEIEHFHQLANDVDDSLSKFSGTEQALIHDMRAIALLLTEIYLGAENLMLRIAKSLDETIPVGKARHAELLEQFSTETPNIRPALFRSNTISQLDEFRRFRHVVHHVYSFGYDWSQIRKLLIMAEPLLTNLIRDTQAFRIFLLDSITAEE